MKIANSVFVGVFLLAQYAEVTILNMAELQALLSYLSAYARLNLVRTYYMYWLLFSRLVCRGWHA